MSGANRWLLPDGVKEVLPPEAGRIETLRRRLLDLHHSWGYDLVMPPLIEFIESLLTGTGNDLDVETFKVIDQLTGRTMGIRADITPQVARIDAHSLGIKGVNRLCYSNTVLHTSSANPLASRTPLQVGAELYGHAGLDSDLEIISLMLESITHVGVDAPLTLDLGHVGIYRGLLAGMDLSSEQEQTLFDLLQTKALADIDAFVASLDIPVQDQQMLHQLARLYGDISVLETATQAFASASAEVLEAVRYMQQLAAAVQQRFPSVTLYFDLAELRGYQYHTGVVFAALTPAFGQPIAKGGRYDDIGRVFGRARPATGFSADLKILVELSTAEPVSAACVVVPSRDGLSAEQCQLLWQKEADLRSQGFRVLAQLSGQTISVAKPTRQLSWRDGAWHLD
ncbi:MAG: ATP phosphoribosyltransferase regulatory subunit [Gammaproteobacteria bacterium]|nr:ATP phosphoribosyltransferase regulatory subunit [Gammaproteobacteria bacterium]